MLAGNVEFDKVKTTGKRGYKLEPNYDKFPPIIIDDSLEYVRKISYEFKEAKEEKLIIYIYKLK